MCFSCSWSSLESLPLEVLAQVLKYFDEEHRFHIKLTCRKLYQAYQLLPHLPAQTLVEAILKGDTPDGLFTSTCDDNQVLMSIRAAVKSNSYSLICESKKIPADTHGHCLILLAVANEIDSILQLSLVDKLKKMWGGSLSVEHLEASIAPALLEHGETPTIVPVKMLKYVPASLMQSLFQAYYVDARITYALSCFNLATTKYLVEKCSQNCSECMWGGFGSILQQHCKATLSCLFYPLNDINKPLLKRCVRRCTDSTNDFQLNKIMKKALWAGELPLDDWVNQIICWLVLAKEKEPLGVDLLLRYPKIDLVQCDFLPLRICYEEKNAHAVQGILYRINWKDLGSRIFNYVGGYGNVHQLDLLGTLSHLDHQKVLQSATERGNVKVLEHMIKVRKSVTDSEFNDCLKLAVRRHKLVSIEFLFSNLPDTFEACIVGHKILFKSIEAKASIIVSWLLKQSFINPAFNENEAIVRAVDQRFSSTEVVRVLLKDKRVDPSVRNNEPFKSVFFQIYSISLDSPKYYGAYYENKHKLAHGKDYTITAIQIGKLLLMDDRVRQNLAQMYPERENFGLSGSLFALDDPRINV